jgi:hypothetical protein
MGYNIKHNIIVTLKICTYGDPIQNLPDNFGSNHQVFFLIPTNTSGYNTEHDTPILNAV